MRFIKILFFIMFFINSSCATSQKTLVKKDDFKIVGFHLDLRIQVMKIEALKDFATKLSSLGINTLIMEWEATFPFESHPLIPNKLSYTKEEIADFISHCNKLKIDVIPMQQSLGHLEYVLRHDRYAEEREDIKDVSQICPMETKLNKELFTALFTEIAKAHTSKYIHIGGDEAYLFGQCDKCSAKVKAEGKSVLLADHLKLMCDIVLSLGKIPVLWADIATKYPEELSKLPKETIFIVWNYGWNLDLFGKTKELTDRGFEVWGALALRSSPDNFFLTDWEKHFKNIKDFIPVARNRGYSGIIMTSWSTSGIYSTVFEDKQTITDLLPVRNVYPISGFQILLEAFVRGIKEKEGLDIEKFIISYSKKQFNFNQKEALQFWKALKGLPYEVTGGKVENHKELTVEMLRDSVRENQKMLNALQPQNNKKEFEHYRLMTDIRENYLTFKCIEVYINSIEFNKGKLKDILEQLKAVINKDAEIKKRFIDLNKDLLYFDEIELENQTRIKRVLLLYERLAKIKVR